MKSALAVLGVVLISLAAYCCVPHYPLGYTSYVRLDPPPDIYHVWYLDVCECANASRVNHPFDVITFYLADDLHNTETGKVLGGLFRAPSTIYIRTQDMYTQWIVKHEILHYLGFGHDDSTLWNCSEMLSAIEKGLQRPRHQQQYPQTDR